MSMSVWSKKKKEEIERGNNNTHIYTHTSKACISNNQESICKSPFEKSDLFSLESLELGAETNESKNSKISLSNKERKICPRCQKPGSGTYSRWCKKRNYNPYYFFAHKINGKIKWCYISRALVKEALDNEKEAP